MEIKINLYKDWLGMIDAHINLLKKQGFCFETYKKWKERQIRIKSNSLPDKNINLLPEYRCHQICTYLDFTYRLIEPKPRIPILSKEFICPRELEEGLESLMIKIKEGKNLFPHLSRNIFNMSAQDGMLFDWGIQHLHLGIKQDKKYPSLVEGQNEIVYCIVNEKNIYFLQIENHGEWANKKLLQIVESNWPELLYRYRIDIPMSNGELSESDRMNLRKVGMNTLTVINGESYFSPGGGISSTRGSIKSTSILQNTIHFLEYAEKIIKDETLKNLVKIETMIQNKLENIMYNLKEIDGEKLIIWDNNKLLKVILYFDKNDYTFKSICFDYLD